VCAKLLSIANLAKNPIFSLNIFMHFKKQALNMILNYF